MSETDEPLATICSYWNLLNLTFGWETDIKRVPNVTFIVLALG